MLWTIFCYDDLCDVGAILFVRSSVVSWTRDQLLYRTDVSKLTSNVAGRRSRLSIHEARSSRATPGKRGMVGKRNHNACSFHSYPVVLARRAVHVGSIVRANRRRGRRQLRPAAAACL